MRLPRRSGRSLLDRITLAAPGLARLLRVAVLRLDPAARVRRALVARTLGDVYAAFNRRDWEAALALAHPDFERQSVSPFGYLDVEPYSRGHQGWIHFIEQWFESWDDFRLEPQEVIDFGDRVMVLVQRRGRGRAALELDQASADLYHLEGGFAVRYDDYWERKEAFEAFGLSP